MIALMESNETWGQLIGFYYRSLRRLGLLPFEPDFYLLMGDDVRSAGVDPFQHWVDHGRHEGRPRTLGALPEALDRHLGSNVEDPSKKNLLLVSHEASLTGAPVLCLNLVKGLADIYNVHVLLLKDGALRQEFVNASCSVHVARSGISHVDVAATLQLLERRRDFDRVIVNSVVSNMALRVLSWAQLRPVCLIHEFASYVSPLSMLEDVVKHSQELVFSAPIVLADARRLLGERGVSFKAHVLPQGKCEAGHFAAEQFDESARIRAAVRPDDTPSRVRVIIGAGTVCFRKGVDLFIQAADILVRTAPEQVFKFVWVGHGFDPRKDVQYSAYLEQQVLRSSLSGRFVFLGEVAELEHVYALADAFWLTSRLDPLPNVGIDAICRGLPIFCFKDASGIADALVDEGLEHVLVPGYLDPVGLAEMTRALFAGAEEARLALTQDLRGMGARRFSMKNYIDGLVEIVEGRVDLPEPAVSHPGSLL
jgi:glycosyltransferase involved in cell wall biosynthesis